MLNKLKRELENVYIISNKLWLNPPGNRGIIINYLPF